MKWFTGSGSGRMAKRSAEPLANAVLEELRAWHLGERDPQEISRTWTGRLHAPKVAELILHLENGGIDA
jgi:hypothetical protein